ncbi:MAG: hypothetical protein NZ518_03980, partial [Dehalococcoidia bacterium]|nr:hypothetical protein [Dehalococcoidia bacterium]
TLTNYQQRGVPFRIRYPDTWAVDDQDAPDGPVIFSPPSQHNDFVQVQLSVRAPELGEWYRQVLDNAGQDTREFRILSEAVVTVDNQPARRAEFRFTTQAGREQRVALVMTRSPQGVGAVLALSADSTSYPALVRVFDEMLRTFTLLP